MFILLKKEMKSEKVISAKTAKIDITAKILYYPRENIYNRGNLILSAKNQYIR